MLKVEVRSRIVGTTKPEEGLPNIALELLNEQLTVRDLISQTVEEQIRDLLLHQKLDTDKARNILHRQYLTDADVQAQSKTGAVKVPSEKPQRPIAIPNEVEKALDAFERGVYLVVVDGSQADTLDKVLTLTPTSKITFLRLTPLVGG